MLYNDALVKKKALLSLQKLKMPGHIDLRGKAFYGSGIHFTTDAGEMNENTLVLMISGRSEKRLGSCSSLDF